MRCGRRGVDSAPDPCGQGTLGQADGKGLWVGREQYLGVGWAGGARTGIAGQ